MPVCRNCNARISKFDKDFCPVCGCANPISSDHTDTVEITSDISLDKELRKKVKVKKKKTAFILSLITPYFGTPFFYLGYALNGLIWFLINFALLGITFVISFFAVFSTLDSQSKLLLSIIIPCVIVYILNIVLGVLFIIKKDYKDKNGELVR